MSQTNDGTRRRLWKRRSGRGANEHNRAADALMSQLKGSLDAADQVLSATPLPSAAGAMDVLRKMGEQTSLMRGNIKVKEEIIARIQGLADIFVAVATVVETEVKMMALDERGRAKDNIRQSEVLKSRVEVFIQKLDSIRVSIEIPQHGTKWYDRLRFAKTDAQLLEDLGRDIKNVTESFQLETSIEIRRHVAELVTSTREIYKQIKENEMRGVLDGLDPADASWRSVFSESYWRLQGGTWIKICDDLARWAVDGDPEKRICIIHGHAGMGKSSIAHAFCKQLEPDHPVSSFFFLRQHDPRADAYRVFPTIACQLADMIPQLRPHIVEAARTHQAGHEMTLDHQFRTLILNPLKALGESAAPPRLVFVLDGVDECGNTPSTVVPSLLRLLHQAAREIPFLRILIATRPEAYILEALHSSGDPDIIQWRDLQKETGGVEHDIYLFIDAELQAIRDLRLLTDRPDAVTSLTRLSRGVFIWASTAIRFLSQDQHLATRKYDMLVASQEAMQSSRLYAQLDELYMAILKYAFDCFRGDEERMYHIRLILAWLTTPTFADAPEFDVTADVLAGAGLSIEITLDVIDRLRPFVVIDGSITAATPIRVRHASFPQFLGDNTRCSDPAFFVDLPSGHALIAGFLLDFKTCADINRAQDVDELREPIQHYATRYWHMHLRQARHTPKLWRSLRAVVGTEIRDWLLLVKPDGSSRQARGMYTQ